ncbi:hypothetical protein BU26DRAFT_15971 [Trematosphaeria pertusa]|uniref:Uncharacterized protein n=1 Tax=Trematosphaeria pertusa TaxID=390896 RepID=A0A6A6J2P4_9PLEO|nr:uncharacterized protein BU26DRAFT_15971 [Trematosphaeria pertusa]KAF2256180.1 hypothetical protein BU26DRAFT_15971 [Trematosphaeria pertusa]
MPRHSEIPSLLVSVVSGERRLSIEHAQYPAFVAPRAHSSSTERCACDDDRAPRIGHMRTTTDGLCAFLSDGCVSYTAPSMRHGHLARLPTSFRTISVPLATTATRLQLTACSCITRGVGVTALMVYNLGICTHPRDLDLIYAQKIRQAPPQPCAPPAWPIIPLLPRQFSDWTAVSCPWSSQG